MKGRRLPAMSRKGGSALYEASALCKLIQVHQLVKTSGKARERERQGHANRVGGINVTLVRFASDGTRVSSLKIVRLMSFPLQFRIKASSLSNVRQPFKNNSMFQACSESEAPPKRARLDTITIIPAQQAQNNVHPRS
jgi:hypothetical protein